MSLRKTWAIAVREFGYYFVSPIVYGFLTVFLLLTGYFTVSMVVFAQKAELNIYLMLFILMLMTPVLCMRLIAAERNDGTIEFIFTSPVRAIEFVLGKFLAVLGVYGVALIFTVEFPIFLLSIGDPDIMILATQYLGMLLVGAMFLSIGLFFSALSENQIVAGIATFFVLLFLWVISLLRGMVPSQYTVVVEAFDITQRVQNFQQGILNLDDVTFFLSFIIGFLYSAILYLNSRSWQE